MTDVCPICLTPFPEDQLDGLCPACFLTEAGESSGPSGLVRGAEIARGGVGIVYEAQQIEPQRAVALKVLQPQWADNEPVRERFRREARAMASLEHPAILPVYEVGESDGLPWFTMKLATGGSLAARIHSYSGQWQRTAGLLVKMARALGFAHERGLLHRDVKPGNILFDGDGSPYLADFGLVKHQAGDAAHLALTLDAGVLGTPNYLAPELASGTSSTATTASDIYSMGAVLYELLSGQPPHEGRSLPALLRLVADEKPRSLTEFRPAPPRDLASICEKAMVREPEHRYASAREMADDLSRFMRGEAVLARQASTLESVMRWARRHPAVAALGAVVIALVIMLTLGSTVALVRISQAERAAVAARDTAEANVRRSKLAEAEGMRRARQPRFRVHVLERIAEAGSPNEDAEFHVDRRSEAIATLAFPQLRVHELQRPDPDWKVVAVSSGLEYLASRGPKGWRLMRDRDGVVVCESATDGMPQRISRDGRRVATMNTALRGWKLWDTSGAEAKLMGSFRGYPEDLSDDGRLVAFYHRTEREVTTAQVQETETGRVRFELSFPLVSLKMRFNPEATLCAVAPSFYLNDTAFPYSVKLHRSADGEVERELSAGMANCIWTMAWSRDGAYLAAGERGGAAIIWNAVTGNPRHTLRGNGSDMWLMAFSEDGQYLSTVSNDRLVSVIDLVSGLPVARGHAWIPQGVPAMYWSASFGDIFGPVLLDRENSLIGVDRGVYSTFSAPESNGSALGIAIAPNGRWLAVGDSRNARVWDLNNAPQRYRLAPGLWNSFAFSPDGKWLYGAGEPGAARWRVDQDGVQPGSVHLMDGPGRHNAVIIDHSGQRLAIESPGLGGVRLHTLPDKDWGTFQDVTIEGKPWIDLSADGGLLAAAGSNGVEVWRLADSTCIVSQKQPAHWVSISPDGEWLILGRERYEVWRTREGTQVATLPSRPMEPELARAAFTQDGHWLVTGHPFGKLALWKVADWQRFAVLESPNSQPVGRLAFDRGNGRLFNASTSGVVEVWDLKMLNQELKKIGLGW